MKYKRNTILLLFILMCGVSVLCWILYPDSADSGPYLDSAHGNSTDGVNRPRTAGFGYAVGNCAHCHEQHASINGQVITPYGYELFYDHWEGMCDLFCYRCHSNLSGVEQQVNNYVYGCSFGGGACTSYTSVRSHFCNDNSDYVNCGSKHQLAQIRKIIQNNGYGWGFPADPDPCSACHNPHLSQRRGSKQNHPPYEPSKSAIVRPSEHKTKPLNLWGDETTERMLYYAQTTGGIYQAPYYGSNPSSTYEPAGDLTSNGSNMPDYVSFCMDCHQYQQYDPERGANVKAINWGATGDRHGGYRANDCTVPGGFDEGSLRGPYIDKPFSNYILSCTDCHEPHAGRKRLHLIRRFINGENLPADGGGYPNCDEPVDMRSVCERCHVLPPSGHTGNQPCFASNCHGHGVKWAGIGFCQNKPNF